MSSEMIEDCEREFKSKIIVDIIHGDPFEYFVYAVESV